MSQGRKSESAIPAIDVPAIHPRQRVRKGAAQAENARLRAALTRIQHRATFEPDNDHGKDWEAIALSLAETLGGIHHMAATALAGES